VFRVRVRVRVRARVRVRVRVNGSHDKERKGKRKRGGRETGAGREGDRMRGWGGCRMRRAERGVRA
jgi:hypothetical protein